RRKRAARVAHRAPLSGACVVGRGRGGAHGRHCDGRVAGAEASIARRRFRRTRGAWNEYVLRHADACETTLNPGFKWERSVSIGLPAARRTCTPGFLAPPWS